VSTARERELSLALVRIVRWLGVTVVEAVGHDDDRIRIHDGDRMCRLISEFGNDVNDKSSTEYNVIFHMTHTDWKGIGITYNDL
jgi:hypothetical protein